MAADVEAVLFPALVAGRREGLGSWCFTVQSLEHARSLVPWFRKAAAEWATEGQPVAAAQALYLARVVAEISGDETLLATVAAS